MSSGEERFNLIDERAPEKASPTACIAAARTVIQKMHLLLQVDEKSIYLARSISILAMKSVV
ncbi:MAG TPA: hypothetical protein VF172_00030, partial [Nitrososphaera sp.]